MDPGTKIHTIFCAKISTRYLTLMRHGMILTLYIMIVYTIFYISNNRNEHPLKQRAPKLTIIHLAFILLYISVLYLLEWLPLNQWKNVNSPEDVPISRVICKQMVYFLRFTIPSVYYLKTLVIYLQWKVDHRSNSAMKYFAREWNSLKWYLGLLSVFFGIVLIIRPQASNLFYPSLNWYDPSEVASYKFSALGLTTIGEFLLISINIYILRNFPNAFGLKKEMLMVFCSFYITGGSSVMLNLFGLGDSRTQCLDYLPPYFTPQFLFEYLRTLAMAIFVMYFNRRLPMMLPTPTRMLFIFKIFISNTLCRDVFVAYLYSRESNNCDLVISQFEQYLRSEIERTSENELGIISSNISSGSTGSSIPSELSECFSEYQETISFEKVKNTLEQYESIFHLRFKVILS